ncbi:hypothetical protein Dimus_033615 [Dionaea muscipula]
MARAMSRGSQRRCSDKVKLERRIPMRRTVFAARDRREKTRISPDSNQIRAVSDFAAAATGWVRAITDDADRRGDLGWVSDQAVVGGGPWRPPTVTVLTVYIVTALCLKKGMNHFVLAVYQHVATTFAIAPFVLVLERSPTSPFPCILGSVRVGDT